MVEASRRYSIIIINSNVVTTHLSLVKNLKRAMKVVFMCNYVQVY